MGARDYQLGVKDEAVYGTPVTVDKFKEYAGAVAAIKGIAARTEGNPLRGGSRARPYDRSTPYFDHGEGSITLDVMDKGFGFFLPHMLGKVATTGAGPYTHTATDDQTETLYGKSFTAQLNYPFNPAGTNQAVTFSGGKIKKWSLANTVSETLVAEFECDFAAMATGVALATASYPTSMTGYTWAGGVVTVGGVAVDVSEVEISGENNYNLDSKRIRANTMQKEPKAAGLDVSVQMKCDFESLAHWDRVFSTTRSGTQATFSAVWTLGTSSITVTIPVLQFNDLDLDGDVDLSQTLSGVGVSNRTDSVVSIAYVTSDATPI